MQSMTRPLIAANWKMNGMKRQGVDLSRQLRDRLAETTGRDIVLCPPFTLLAILAEVLAGGGLALGAQDCHAAPAGAFTGDIAAGMLADIGCRYVILGHSERRIGYGETDSLVKAKASAALGAGLIPIICVGETEAERDAGRAPAVISRQVLGSIPDDSGADDIVLAYEPVWAIGTGRSAAAEEIESTHRQIRDIAADRLGRAPRVLYGGSVKPSNAAEIMALSSVGGVLVGGAALDVESFAAIVDAAA